MKKCIILALLVSSMLLLFGCGNDNNNDGKSNPEQNKTSSTSEVALSKDAIDENQENARLSKDAIDKNQKNTDIEKEADENQQNINYEKEIDENQKKSEKEESKSKQKIAFQKKVASYPLGLNVKELKSKFKKDGCKITLPPDFDEGANQYGAAENPIKDGRIYQYDESYFFYTKYLTFYYTNKNKNFEILVNDKYKTDQGIGIGQSKSEVEKTYGKKYNKREYIHEYYDGKTYLTFFIIKDKVRSWSISTLPVDFNAP